MLKIGQSKPFDLGQRLLQLQHTEEVKKNPITTTKFSSVEYKLTDCTYTAREENIDLVTVESMNETFQKLSDMYFENQVHKFWKNVAEWDYLYTEPTFQQCLMGDNLNVLSKQES